MKTKTFWIISILFIVSVAIMLKGCNDSRSDLPSQPKDTQAQGVTLEFSEDSAIAAKAANIMPLPTKPFMPSSFLLATVLPTNRPGPSAWLPDIYSVSEPLLRP